MFQRYDTRLFGVINSGLRNASGDQGSRKFSLRELQPAPAVDDFAKKLRRALSVVDGGVRLARVERQAGGEDRLAQHGLSISQAAQGGGIEAAEGVERVALVAHPAHRRIKEGKVESRVMAHEDRALAFRDLYGFPDRIEDVIERLALGQGAAKGMIGVDSGHFQRTWVDIRARK